jgi:hypothetical protein
MNSNTSPIKTSIGAENFDKKRPATIAEPPNTVPNEPAVQDTQADEAGAGW